MAYRYLLIVACALSLSCNSQSWGKFWADEKTTDGTGGGSTCTAIGACPAGYIKVPCNPTVGTTADFCVAKYEMKCAADATGMLCTGPALSQAANQPWVNITQTAAMTECTSAGAHLITNPEWMTIARNNETTAVNWSTGTINSGALNSGHNDNSPGSALAASTDDTQGCTGTGQTCSDVTWDAQRRTHTLSNGEVIWDFAGNVWEWNDWLVTQANKALGSGGTGAWSEFTTVVATGVMTTSTWQATNAALTSTNGIGQYNAGTADPAAALRGGFYISVANAGVFALDLSLAPSSAGTSHGFRCAK